MARLLLAIAVAGCGAAPPPAAAVGAHASASSAFAIDELAVTIPARDLELEGTLSVPRAPGPRPAIVLLHGSGPFGRDAIMDGQLGERFGHDVAVLRDLAHHLGRAGFVVLRYDKRTCTRATGCTNAYPEGVEVGFDEIVADAQAAIEWLGQRPEVDPHAIYLLGHSLGGALVPELMTDNPGVRAGVILAAPYRPIDAVSAYQEEFATQLAQRHDRHPLLVGIRVRTLRQIATGTRRLRQGILRDSHIADVPVAFWAAWMDLGDALPALIDRLDRPVLALSGAADSNVPASETALWKARLEAARPNPGHESAVIPCVSHALNCLEPTPGRHVSPAVLDRVVRFLRAHPPR